MTPESGDNKAASLRSTGSDFEQIRPDPYINYFTINETHCARLLTVGNWRYICHRLDNRC